MLKRKKTMPSGKPGHGSKRPTDAQPQNEILRSRGLGGNPQQAAPEAEWLSRGIACLFLRYIKRTSGEILKFHPPVYSFSSFLESPSNSSANPRVWCNKTSRISGGQFE